MGQLPLESDFSFFFFFDYTLPESMNVSELVTLHFLKLDLFEALAFYPNSLCGGEMMCQRNPGSVSGF